MGFMRGLPTFVLIVMVASFPFLQSSRPGFQAETTMTKGLDVIFGNGDSVVGVDEESARQVPTGPDPLHHNNKPTRP